MKGYGTIPKGSNENARAGRPRRRSFGSLRDSSKQKPRAFARGFVSSCSVFVKLVQ